MPTATADPTQSGLVIADTGAVIRLLASLPPEHFDDIVYGTANDDDDATARICQ